MSKTTTIQAETRARSGSGVLKQLRREGLLPSVIYGKGIENINLKINAKAFRQILANSSSDSIVVNLEIDGNDTRMAFLKDVQYDALSGQALHADFRAIDDKTTITASVSVQAIGTAPGVAAGGLVDMQVHSLEISCLPGDLPEVLEVDISGMEVGDSINIGGISFPPGVTPTLNDEVVVVQITKPAAAISEDADSGETAPAEGGEEANAEGGDAPATEESSEG
ncbi:MAG: 50S ribosomal protein L25 [Luteolibacter sp.]